MVKITVAVSPSPSPSIYKLGEVAGSSVQQCRWGGVRGGCSGQMTLYSGVVCVKMRQK